MASRRNFLKLAGSAMCAAAFPPSNALGFGARPGSARSEARSPDYVLRIAASPVEIAPKQIVSTIAYNGHFPGPLLRFEEGRSARAPLQKIPACCRAILWDADGKSFQTGRLVPSL